MGATYVSREGIVVHPASRDRRRPLESSDQRRPADRIRQTPALPESQPVDPQSTPLWQDILNIPVGDYEQLWRFVSDNPRTISSSDISLLTSHALAEEKTGHANTAHKCIHHAILLQRCLTVESIRLFFTEMSNNQSDTYRRVYSDINTAYANLQARARDDRDHPPRGGHNPRVNKLNFRLNIQSTEGDKEKLDPRKCHKFSLPADCANLGFAGYHKWSKAETFFALGRVCWLRTRCNRMIWLANTMATQVFAVLWHEHAGSGQSNTDRSRAIQVTRGHLGEYIYSHILRMVVVREGRGSCWCL
jgi:hypothetical protein